VLELLSSQMKDASSLAQVRNKRDTLMDKLYAMPAEVEVSTIPADKAGVPILLVRPPDATNAQVVLLVHGGMFMAGSGRAMRHVAAKLALELGVAVATPSLRLAPEHPHPAALDDLCTAYDFIRERGLGDTGGAPPQRIALFAESSGGALALSMMLRKKAAHEPLPCVLTMSSPWLDLTCSGGSFIVHEEYDLVLQKARMEGIVESYLAGGSVENVEASPLLCAPESLAGLPPTLVHVGDNEVLLDDARTFAHTARLHNSEVSLKEWPGVVHAWHTFFPLMPAAEKALLEMVDFIRPLLFAVAADLKAGDEGAPPRALD